MSDQLSPVVETERVTSDFYAVTSALCPFYRQSFFFLKKRSLFNYYLDIENPMAHLSA